eukprot:scaffold230487_cov31-Tisochrysis_lutea.AAC.2
MASLLLLSATLVTAMVPGRYSDTAMVSETRHRAKSGEKNADPASPRGVNGGYCFRETPQNTRVTSGRRSCSFLTSPST